MRKKVFLTIIILLAFAVCSASYYFYWQKSFNLSSDILSPASQKISVSPAPKSSRTILAPTPSPSSIPIEIITAHQTVRVSFPKNKMVVAKEKIVLADGLIIVEQIVPQSQKIPPAIIEEKSPSEAIVPVPSLSPAPSPTSPPSTSLFTTSAADGGEEVNGSASLAPNSTSTQVISTSTSAVFTSSATTLPEVLIYLSEYSLTARKFTVIWQSSSTDVLFDVQQKQGLGNWQSWISDTTSTSTLFAVPQDLTTYFFRARAADNATTTTGNATSSDWQEISAPISFFPVAINEIAWAGTSASTSADEWIELYNKINQQIDLSGWILRSASDNTPSSTLVGKIEPNGFFLLERTGDDTIIDVPADQIYTGALNNTGETIELLDKFGNLIDRIPLSSDSNRWLAGSGNPDYQSMERVNPYLPANVLGNWQSNSTSTRNGFNADSQPVNGTPKAPNSVFDLNFFYLYPAQNITATSTFLKWTPSFLSDFKEYRVMRFLADSSSTPSVIAAMATSTVFFDQTLESETDYNYKILACDNLDNCISSNAVLIKTPEFPFGWVEPRAIAEAATSSPAQLFEFSLDDSNQPLISWINATSSSPDISSSSENLILPVSVLNKKSEPYVFWIGTSSSIYFNFLGANQLWRTPKKIFEFSWTIKELKAIIDSENVAHLAWLVASDNKIYYTFSKIE